MSKTSPNKYNYNRPEVTFQDTLQNKESMLKRLENYERVDSIDEVPINTHVRYVTLDKEKKQVFRLGGLLLRIHPQYIQLSNGNHRWSVQRYHYSDDESNDEPIFETVFWRVISKETVLKRKVDTLEEENTSLKEENDSLKEELEKRLGELSRLKNYIRANLKQ